MTSDVIDTAQRCKYRLHMNVDLHVGHLVGGNWFTLSFLVCYESEICKFCETHVQNILWNHLSPCNETQLFLSFDGKDCRRVCVCVCFSFSVCLCVC